MYRGKIFHKGTNANDCMLEESPRSVSVPTVRPTDKAKIVKKLKGALLSTLELVIIFNL